ncbi:hypothetical protein CEXT_277511 [Caerostris extrusa]|uniref:Transmembrane protein n=1 Tax=Caerostris extrusa TaxID=172846 RepID=A0AAV4SLF9_CAEEX|nr:hypothetical protein CEXT_277511 [Caerostris extrusa]
MRLRRGWKNKQQHQQQRPVLFLPFHLYNHPTNFSDDDDDNDSEGIINICPRIFFFFCRKRPMKAPKPRTGVGFLKSFPSFVLGGNFFVVGTFPRMCCADDSGMRKGREV